MRRKIMTKDVYFVVYDDVQLLDVSGPAGVLAMANSVLGENIYNIHYVSSSMTGKIMANNSMTINTDPLPNLVETDILIVPGALEDAMSVALKDKTLMDWLANIGIRCETKISVCLGAFFFAELGWFDGKRATTHWACIEQLKNNYTTIQVMDDTLYQNDGNVWSSGGVLSGVDMMLAFVSQNLGIDTALKIAKLLVVYLFRDGGQSQYSVPVEFQSRSRDKSIVSLIAWLETRIEQPTSVKEMAEYSSMSIRKLHSRCQEFFALGPAQLFMEIRLENARTLLRDEHIPIQEVAFCCGFNQTATFSRAFSRRYGVSPSRYRESFSSL